MSEKELRELDAWIAEHVMGWKWWRFSAPPVGGRRNPRKRDKWCQLVPPSEKWPHHKTEWRGIRCGCAIEGMEDYTDLSSFHPSESSAVAMDVLKKCAEKTFPSVYKSRQSPDLWCVDNQSSQPTKTTIIKTSPTLELAICLFAKDLFAK